MRQAYDVIDPHARRRTALRTIFLFLIILGTLPFYVLGFWLWGSAQANEDGNTQIITTSTSQPGQTAQPTLRPTNTPIVFPTLPQPLQSTPPQFIIPTRVNPTNTSVFIPIPTTAPTLTPFPTSTPFPTALPPPSDTPLPPPSDTPEGTVPVGP